MITFVGVMFDPKEQFGSQEHAIVRSIIQQIEQRWPQQNNLVINLTWFGPQFDNTAWHHAQALIEQQHTFDQIFWVCAVDPVCIPTHTIDAIQTALHSKHNYYLGVGFSGEHTFNTHAIVVADEFPEYTVDQLLMTTPTYCFINYNRKPKPHRIQLAERLNNRGGIVTLGKNDVDYPVNEGVETQLFLAIDDQPQAYTHNGKFNLHTDFGGIPYDLCSLGRLDLWQQHFLNIVSETVYYPWDTTFVTEKTWKPIVGLRPFVINGQTQIYQWLRDHGFRTFNQYWEHIPVETATELNIHDAIVQVAEFVQQQTPTQLSAIYTSMLPDLLHNRNRFAEFAAEQKHKINNLFV